jgi:thiosulfate reductase cytochrome b subunit
MNDNNKCPNTTRGCCKIAVVFILAALLLTGLLYLVDAQAVDELKHTLSVWTIVALVIIINLVSFLCFIILHFAWKWAQSDFKASNKNDIDE